MLKMAAIFSEKAAKKIDVDLSDEELFDMGPYNLIEENLLQPNAHLKNLFGGAKQPEMEEIRHLKNEDDLHSEDSKHRIEFTDDDEEAKEKSFKMVFSMHSTLEYVEKHSAKL